MQGQGLALRMRNLRTQPNPNTFSWSNKIINLMRLYIKATFIAHKLYNTLHKPLVFLGTNLATI